VKGLLAKVLARGLRLEPAKRQVVWRTKELQEGRPARDDLATFGVLTKERERMVRQARRTVSFKFGLVDLLSIFLYVYFGWLRELATGPHSQKRASPRALC